MTSESRDPDTIEIHMLTALDDQKTQAAFENAGIEFATSCEKHSDGVMLDYWITIRTEDAEAATALLEANKIRTTISREAGLSRKNIRRLSERDAD